MWFWQTQAFALRLRRSSFNAYRLRGGLSCRLTKRPFGAESRGVQAVSRAERADIYDIYL